MQTTTKNARTFPVARIHPRQRGLPVEVTLIAQLDRGGGDRLIEDASARQRGHENFVDALDEPSTRIGGVDLGNGDATSLYTFAVGTEGHPFHRHAGHRVFTAISGGAGARLRFSTASTERIARDPHAFVAELHHVDVPPDSVFVVRFGGGVWHQFLPLGPGSKHPALFALSCHTNELGGDLAPALRRRVLDGAASIPALTELLPAAVRSLLDGPSFDAARVPTTVLSLGAPPRPTDLRGALRRRIAAAFARLRRPHVPRAHGGEASVRELDALPADSLLRTQFADAPVHEDTFERVVASGTFATASASTVLAAILAGFLESRPRGVSRLMAFRNVLVKPLGLRTSPLGCPASSLLSATAQTRFAGRFPVLAQRVDAADARAEVILGADDRHLAFRSCVGVERLPDGRMRCTLGTRVRTRNGFGRFYMALVDPVHRSYVAPAMLGQAVDHAAGALAGASSTAENGESDGSPGVSMGACKLPLPVLVSTRASASARA
jgi:hypothetical protein